MQKVKFIKQFSVKAPGDEKVYEDQYADYLVNLGVAVFVVEKLESHPIETKEEKIVVKRTTKNAKN